MITELTKEQIEEINRNIQRERGSKGGRAWWDSLTPEQRKERIEKMESARNTKRHEK